MITPNILVRRMLGLLICGLLFNTYQLCAETNDYPSFHEVLDTIKKNMPSGASQDWEKLAIDGLLSQLDGKAILVSPKDKTTNATQRLFTCPQLFDASFAYLRLLNIEKSIGEQALACLNKLNKTNAIKGLIIDLRFARGGEYQEIQQLLDPFIDKEIVLFKSRDQTWKTNAKTNAYSFPVVALVNRQTRGAAEALSGVMQNSKVALLIGSTTSGQALGYSEFPLSQGFRLKIAQEPLQFADGRVLSTKGVIPDVQVPATIEVEWHTYTNSFPKESSVQSTNLNSSRSRINEAQLVRMQKEGKSLQDLQSLTNTRPSEASEAPMQDQVLARALDLLKALYAIQPKSR
jgi:hypothetical protein